MLGAILGGLGAIAGAIFQDKANKSAWQRNRDSEIEFWNMQNEYNSPLNQRKRLEEAGLNPALLYGQSAGGVAGNTSSAPRTPNVAIDAQSAKAAALQQSLAILGQITDLEIKQDENERAWDQHDQSSTMANIKQFTESVAAVRSVDELNVWRRENISAAASQRREQSWNAQTARDRLNTAIDHMTARYIEESVNAGKGDDVNFLKAKIDAVKKSNQLKQIAIDNQHSLINPNDPMSSRIAAAIVQEIFRGATLPEGFDIDEMKKNFLNFLNPFK